MEYDVQCSSSMVPNVHINLGLGTYVPKLRSKSKEAYSRKYFVYFACVDGAEPEFFRRLSNDYGSYFVGKYIHVCIKSYDLSDTSAYCLWNIKIFMSGDEHTTF